MNLSSDITGQAAIGVVLAGGRSSRMGRDKAELRIGGRSLLRRAQDTLADCGCSVAISGRQVGAAAFIPDLVPGHGPAAAIVSCAAWAARHAPCAAMLFLPVDMPTIDAASLSRLMAALGGADAAHYLDHPLPLALAPTPAVRARIAEQLLAGAPAISVRALLRGLRATVLDAVDAAVLSNVNTPLEWARTLAAAAPARLAPALA